MTREKLKIAIIEVLKSHPNGLKAREISSKIKDADKSSVNSILYADSDLFSAKDYIWTLKLQEKVKNDTKPKQISSEKALIEKRGYGSYSHIGVSKIKSSASGFTSQKANTNNQRLKEAQINDERIRLYLEHPHLDMNMSLSQMHMELSKERKKVYKKCTGVCSLCKRDKCINDM